MESELDVNNVDVDGVAAFFGLGPNIVCVLVILAYKKGYSARSIKKLMRHTFLFPAIVIAMRFES